MGWLSNEKSLRFQPQPAAETSQKSASPTRPGGGASRLPAIQYNKDWDVDRSVTDALEKVTWVFRCVEAIASNAARVPLLYRRGNAYDGTEIPNHPMNNILNSQSNPGETSYVFRYRLSAQLMLSKYGVFVELIRNQAGNVIGLYLLPPQYVTPIKDPEKFVSGYEFNMPISDEYGRITDAVQKIIPPEDMIWLRKPHPFDPYGSLTVLSAAGLSIETDWHARMYNRNFLLNDGRPGGIVVIKGDTTDEDEQELKSRFRGGTSGAGRITVITSDDGADFVDTAVNPRDAQYTESRAITKDEILLAFGVPETVLANASQRTLDNAETERLVFWQETMLPHLEPIMRGFDVLDPKDNVYCGPDLDRVDVLQRMDMKRKEYSLREFDGGTVTVNEYRQATGRKTLPGDVGDVLFRANTRIPYATTSGKDIPDMPLIAKPGDTGNLPGRPQNNDVVEQPEADPRDYESDNRPVELPNSTSKSIEDDVLAKMFVKQIELSYDHWDMVVTQAFKRFFDRQRRVIGEKMDGQKMRKLLDHRERALMDGPSSGPSVNPALKIQTSVSAVYDKSMWDRQLDEDILPLLKSIATEFGEMVNDKFDVDKIEVAGQLAKQMDRVKKINDNTMTKIEEIIAAGILAEKSSSDIASDIDKMFEATSDDRAKVAANTEITAAAMGAKLLAVDDQTLTKTWVTMGDSRVRDSHDALDGQTVAIHEPFVKDGVKLMFPGDPSSAPEEVINCRCAMVLSNETTL